MIRAALLFAAAVVLCRSVGAETIEIEAAHLGDGRSLRMQFFAPQGASESLRPAAILLHGCGGIGAKGKLNPRHTMWKDWLVERGFVVVFPESFSSRGFDEICTQKFSARTLKQSDRVADVMAAKRWLLARKDIDPTKLLLWGWSHGAGTVLATITRTGEKAHGGDPPFAHAISFYPGCSSYAKSTNDTTLSSPLTLLIGEADDWTPAAPCKSWIAALQARKQSATITSFPGAYHDFDNPSGTLRVRKEVPNGVKPGEGVTVGPNPQARDAARKLIDALLVATKLTTRTVSNAAPP